MRLPLSIWFPLVFATCVLSADVGLAQSEMREWSDSTGKFKIRATLQEFKDNTAYLRTEDGKTLSIQIGRLSAADQAILKGDANPFQEVDQILPRGGNGMSPPKPQGDESIPGSNSSANGGLEAWDSDYVIPWDRVEELDLGFGMSWEPIKIPQAPPAPTKRITLNRTTSFFEDVRRFQVNPQAQRAVAGYTVSFSVPKPLSRIVLLDTAGGRAVHSAQTEGDFGPLCVLSDGTTVLMQGSEKGVRPTDSADKLQLWRLKGKEIVRSKTWIPFPSEKPQDSGRGGFRSENAEVSDAIAFRDNRVVLLGSNGRLVCIDALTRRPTWHAKLHHQYAISASIDGSLLAVVNEKMILIIDPLAGKVQCALPIENAPHLHFVNVRWSPSQKRIAVSFASGLRVLDVETGEWIYEIDSNALSSNSNSLEYPDEDYVLLGGGMLLHLPTQIQVCQYRDAKRIVCVGETSYIVMQGKEGGLVVPSKMPHPAAREALEKSENDPSVFLLHPGVEVSIKTDQAGEHGALVSESLQKAAERAGYKVVPSAPITLEGVIEGPKQQAVSYIARGSYIANYYQSIVRIRYGDKTVWSRTTNNIPSFLSLAAGESIQGKLDELGRKPDLNIYKQVDLPKRFQKPSEGSSGGNALMTSKFTMQGLVDEK